MDEESAGGITSSWARYSLEEWNSAEKNQLIDEEST
jgi:hypothetical protein